MLSVLLRLFRLMTCLPIKMNVLNREGLLFHVFLTLAQAEETSGKIEKCGRDRRGIMKEANQLHWL